MAPAYLETANKRVRAAPAVFFAIRVGIAALALRNSIELGEYTSTDQVSSVGEGCVGGAAGVARLGGERTVCNRTAASGAAARAVRGGGLQIAYQLGISCRGVEVSRCSRFRT